MKKFHHFTRNNFDIAVSCRTKNIQTLFHLKDKKLYPGHKIYYRVYKCGEGHIDKTKRNTIKRWSRYYNPIKDSEPVRHLNKHINHDSTCKILCHTSKKTGIHKNLEAVFIALLKPSLNE